MLSKVVGEFDVGGGMVGFGSLGVLDQIDDGEYEVVVLGWVGSVRGGVFRFSVVYVVVNEESIFFDNVVNGVDGFVYGLFVFLVFMGDQMRGSVSEGVVDMFRREVVFLGRVQVFVFEEFNVRCGIESFLVIEQRLDKFFIVDEFYVGNYEGFCMLCVVIIRKLGYVVVIVVVCIGVFRVVGLVGFDGFLEGFVGDVYCDGGGVLFYVGEDYFLVNFDCYVDDNILGGRVIVMDSLEEVRVLGFVGGDEVVVWQNDVDVQDLVRIKIVEGS